MTTTNDDDAPRTWKSDAPVPHFDGSTGSASTAGWHKTQAFLRCPKEYQFSEVRGIYKPDNVTPDAFAVGALFHAGRAAWMMDGFGTGEDTWQKVLAAFEKERLMGRLPMNNAAEQRALVITQEYIKHWSVRPKPKPVGVEYLIEGELIEGDPTTKRTARLDDVSYYPEAGGLAIGEAKTTSTPVGDTVSEYTLHGQPLLQMALWKVAERGEKLHGPIKGVVLDVVKKPYGKSEKPDFTRAFIPFSPHTQEWYVENLVRYLGVMAKVTWDSDVPRNVTACTRGAGKMRVVCPYRELCMHGRSAAGEYVLASGQALRHHVPTEGKEKYPWE